MNSFGRIRRPRHERGGRDLEHGARRDFRRFCLNSRFVQELPPRPFPGTVGTSLESERSERSS